MTGAGGGGNGLSLGLLDANSAGEAIASLLEFASGWPSSNDADSDGWRRAVVHLGRISSPFRLEFGGTKRSIGLDTFVIGVDDVRMRGCEFPPTSARSECGANEFRCERRACVPLANRCDLIDDCGDGSDERNCQAYTMCSFDDGGLCDEWRFETGSATMPWHLGNNGRRRDHTIGLGSASYLYVEAPPPFQRLGRPRAPPPPRRDQDEHVARLSTLVMTSTANKSEENSDAPPPCQLRFFYRLGDESGFGRDGGETINVFARVARHGVDNERLLFSHASAASDDGEQITSSRWHRADIDLKRYLHVFILREKKEKLNTYY